MRNYRIAVHGTLTNNRESLISVNIFVEEVLTPTRHLAHKQAESQRPLIYYGFVHTARCKCTYVLTLDEEIATTDHTSIGAHLHIELNATFTAKLRVNTRRRNTSIAVFALHAHVQTSPKHTRKYTQRRSYTSNRACTMCQVDVSMKIHHIYASKRCTTYPNVVQSIVVATVLLCSLCAYSIAQPKDRPTSLQIGIKRRVVDEECIVKATPGSKVSIHYKAFLFGETEPFDSSLQRGEPVEFILGEGRVIRGWDTGILNMCLGEVRKLVVPAKLGYGELGAPPHIPGDADLWYEIELVQAVVPSSTEPKVEL
eukprot:m.18712 g.18712  ORF g.18712 m.18712 type:complete len:312 (+) comp7929_c0_seq3:33-968(+)